MKKKPCFFVTVLLVMTACSAPINNRGWNLVWEENFDGPEIDCIKLNKDSHEKKRLH